MSTRPFQFCPFCATQLDSFQDEEHTRSRCPSCNWIHYRNPTVGVAVILLTEQGLWLGHRRSGGWCIPCGHVEWDESVEDAALRECAEETNLTPETIELFAVLSNFHDRTKQTVGVWYRGYVKNVDAAQAGGDLIDLRPFPLEELPELVFPTDCEVVRRLHALNSG